MYKATQKLQTKVGRELRSSQSGNQGGGLNAAWLAHKSLYGHPGSVLIHAGVLRTAAFSFLEIIQRNVSLCVESFLPSQKKTITNPKCPRAVFFGNVTRERKFFACVCMGVLVLESLVKNN